MQIAREDAPLVFHGKCRGKRLAARRSANVQHLLSARKIRGADNEMRRRVLHGEAPVVESAERRQISCAGKLQTAGDPCVRRDADTFAAQFFRQCGFARLERVKLHAEGGCFVVDAKESFRLLRAHERNELFHQPLRVAVSNAEARSPLLRQRRKVCLVLRDLAQDRVDKPACGAPAVRAAKLHRFAHGGMVGHFVQK